MARELGSESREKVRSLSIAVSYTHLDVYKRQTSRRLRRQQIFGALLLVLTGAFMFFTRGNEWIVSLTIAAILELYTCLLYTSRCV